MQNFSCSLIVLLAASALHGQTPKEPIRDVAVSLGKIPGDGMKMALKPHPLGGPLSGIMERAVPPGSVVVLKDAEGRVISQAPVNQSDRSFQFPALRVALQDNFSACLQSPGVAPICSAPGGLAVLTARERGSGMATGR